MTIPIFFTFDKWYTLAAEVTFYSLLSHGSTDNHYKLYVLSDEITPPMRQRLERVVGKFSNASIAFRDMGSSPVSKRLPKGKSHFSKEIFYKLVAAELFPEHDRILCSDVDVVFEADIAPALYDFAGEDFYFAGVNRIVTVGDTTPFKQAYSAEEQQLLHNGVSAGFMLMNLKRIREAGVQQRLVQFYFDNYHRLLLPEQDCITLNCATHLRHLHWRYCVLNYFYRIDRASIPFHEPPIYPELSGSYDERLKAFDHTLAHPVQIHYVGANKPWNRLGVDRQLTWLKYAWQAGVLPRFVAEFPRQWLKASQRRYSLRRFLRKLFSGRKAISGGRG